MSTHLDFYEIDPRRFVVCGSNNRLIGDILVSEEGRAHFYPRKGHPIALGSTALISLGRKVGEINREKTL